MAKYFIKWNVGYGDSYEVVESETKEEAMSMAYEMYKDEYENNADYDAVLFTEDIAENYGLEDELDG